jgi:splicing factor 3B subunit 2
MTTHGDIYYEGKEDELRARHLKPGRMSAELRNALGISDY